MKKQEVNNNADLLSISNHALYIGVWDYNYIVFLLYLCS